MHLTPTLSLALALPFLPAIQAHSTILPSPDKLPSCKAHPHDRTWPSTSTWAALDDALGGALLHPPPPASICHADQPDYDQAQCSIVTESWKTYKFHTNSANSIPSDFWTGYSCVLDPARDCSGEGYPVYVVNATRPEQVQIAVDFARSRNIRLTIKGGSHDFHGRSMAPNSLLIWTRHIQGIKHHACSFRPRGCRKAIPGTAVTVAAGSTMFDLQNFLRPHGEVAVGGQAGTVGIGGYLTGGGHSILSPRYGLGADQVYELEAVTPDGELVIANECQNEDLFWALRGGGGSTFGVITSVTLKTFPNPKILHDFITFTTIPEASNLTNAQALLLSRISQLTEKGLSGYLFVSGSLPNPTGIGPEFVAGVFGLLVLQDTNNQEDLLRLINPIYEEVQAKFPDTGFLLGNSFETYDSFHDWYDKYNDQSPAGANGFLSSSLLDGPALTDDLGALAATVSKLNELSASSTWHLVAGKGVREAKPRGGEIAVHPGWRKSLYHVVISTGFASFNETDEEKAKNISANATQVLRALNPENGAYSNEAYPYDPKWRESFWGSNYERLLGLKRKYDPSDVFWCHPCVGNDRWRAVEGGRLCRV